MYFHLGGVPSTAASGPVATSRVSLVEETILISAFNQFAYCSRRCSLIHGEHEFADNLHTQRGTTGHERVDALHHEIKAGVRVEFALPIWSDVLGLSGRCDVVEFHLDGAVYPVEYKNGVKQKWFNDDLQLTAQVVCLEEMLSKRIEAGAIFHIQSRRRREVLMTTELRQSVVTTIAAIRALLTAPHLPPPTTEIQRCRGCSMVDICQPEVLRGVDRVSSLTAALYQP